MKTRTALPLMFALCFLMLSVSSGSAQCLLPLDVSGGSAQLNPASPYVVRITLDTAFVTHDFDETMRTPDTIRGSIENLSADYGGSLTMKIKITPAPNWITLTKIGGNAVNDGDLIGIAKNQVLPLEVIVVPYSQGPAAGPDTESYCLTIKTQSGTSTINEKCITLVLANNTSAVSTPLPTPSITLWPNPAANFVSLRGLENMQEVRYEIYSSNGAEVRHGSLPADARISVQDLSSGAYQLLLSDGKRVFSNTAFTILH